MILTETLPARPAAEPLDTSGLRDPPSPLLGPYQCLRAAEGQRSKSAPTKGPGVGGGPLLPGPQIPKTAPPSPLPRERGRPHVGRRLPETPWAAGDGHGPRRVPNAHSESHDAAATSKIPLRELTQSLQRQPRLCPTPQPGGQPPFRQDLPPHTCLPAPSSWGHASSPHGAPAWAPATQETGSRWAHGRPSLYRPFTQARERWALKAPHPHLPRPTPPGERRLLTGTTGPRRLVLEGGGHPAHQNTAGLAQRWCLAEGPGAPRGHGHHTHPARPPARPRPQAPLKRGGGETAGAAGAQSRGWGWPGRPAAHEAQPSREARSAQQLETRAAAVPPAASAPSAAPGRAQRGCCRSVAGSRQRRLRESGGGRPPPLLSARRPRPQFLPGWSRDRLRGPPHRPRAAG